MTALFNRQTRPVREAVNGPLDRFEVRQARRQWRSFAFDDPK